MSALKGVSKEELITALLNWIRSCPNEFIADPEAPDPFQEAETLSLLLENQELTEVTAIEAIAAAQKESVELGTLIEPFNMVKTFNHHVSQYDFWHNDSHD